MACGNNVDPEEEKKEPVVEANPYQITFRQDTLYRQSSHCESDTNKCAKVNLLYPYAESGPTDLCVAFNRLQLKFLKNAIEDADKNEPTPQKSLEELAEIFLKDYEELLSDALTYEMPWVMETEGEILFQNEHFVSVQLQKYTFTGGAHPNIYTTIWMMDKNTKEVLDFGKMQANTDTLLVIAEDAFRSTIDLPKGKKLEEAGFFQGETFFLPQNYALIEEGLLLYYNTYEIAPYVLGPTEVIIPFAGLKPVFDKNKWY